MTPDKLAYVAGVFDGEGCVNFASTRGTSFIRVLVVNTNRELLEHLQSIFGGDIAQMSRREGWKQSWQWRLSWGKAVDFLDVISPWLLVKLEQAQVAFAWDAVRPGRGNRKNAKAEMYHNVLPLLQEQLSFLNGRGSADRGEDPVNRELRETNYAPDQVA